MRSINRIPTSAGTELPITLPASLLNSPHADYGLGPAAQPLPTNQSSFALPQAASFVIPTLSDGLYIYIFIHVCYLLFNN